MKLFCLFAASLVALVCNGGTPTNGSPPLNVQWSITNRIPEKLWVYKVYPQKFSPTVVSNLLSIGGFTETNKAKLPSAIAELDKKAVFYGSIEPFQRHLAIFPTLGYVEYADPKAAASSSLQKVENVPNEKETTELGVEYWKRLGLGADAIAKKPDGEFDLRWIRQTITYNDQTNKAEVKLTNSYGVMLPRAIDGYKVHGFGGLDIEFGNNAKVKQLKLCWRNLRRHELKAMPSVQEITESLKSGKVPVHPLGSIGTIPFDQIRSLNITNATVLYDGPDQEKRVEFIKPYLNFWGVANGSNGVWFEW